VAKTLTQKNSVYSFYEEFLRKFCIFFIDTRSDKMFPKHISRLNFANPPSVRIHWGKELLSTETDKVVQSCCKRDWWI